MKQIILTGGGTAGHVTPNIALLPSLAAAGYQVTYIGSYTGIEKQLIEDLGITYYGISSGKLRRYKSWKNLTDPFRVIAGYFQSRKLIRKIKPNIVFSNRVFFFWHMSNQNKTKMDDYHAENNQFQAAPPADPPAQSRRTW